MVLGEGTLEREASYTAEGISIFLFSTVHCCPLDFPVHVIPIPIFSWFLSLAFENFTNDTTRDR